MLNEASYNISPRGLATSFTESEMPPDYALKFRNRFINAAGGAEKRQGIQQLGDTIAGQHMLDGIHELVDASGNETLFVSGEGRIWSYDGTSAWTLVKSGLDTTNRLRSAQFDDKLIFMNFVDRPFYTKDGTTFTELKAIVERGQSLEPTDQNTLRDSNIEDWLVDSDVAINDIVYNRDLQGYGVVTSVTPVSASATSESNIGHTIIGSAGIATGIGTVLVDGSVEAGQFYEIIDAVELNIIPQPNTTSTDKDNVATATTGTNATTIAVSGVDFSTTDIKVGDFIRNTTRSALTQVSAVGTNLTVASVAGQTANDSLIFLKSAMPIAGNPHVHFGRLYMVDARDRRLVRISGPNNPEDMTAGAGTLDDTSFKYGTQQPRADSVQAMTSFQRFFVIGGKQDVLWFEGTDPIADTTADSTDFDIVALMPQGVISEDGLISIGNEAVWVSPNGVESTTLVGDASTLGRANLSEQIRITLRNAFISTPTSEIILFHYPRRSWLCLKVGSQIYVFNYTAYFGQQQLSGQTRGTPSTQAGSWSVFDGKFARQRAYFVRRSGNLVCCGDGGKVYLFDQGDYTDDGETYTTEYQTAWLTLDEPRKRVNVKQGHYIRPIFDVGANVDYTITAEAPFGVESRETITVEASGGAQPIGLAQVGSALIGGSSIQDPKVPLRWRGKEVRITYTTNDDKGPDVISRFTLYATPWGKR